jgi:hypothetical protein
MGGTASVPSDQARTGLDIRRIPLCKATNRPRPRTRNRLDQLPYAVGLKAA